MSVNDKNKVKRIALDVDGVLLDFMPAFDEAARIILGRDIVVNKDEDQNDHYHLGLRVETTQDKVDEILEYMQTSRMYANLKALEGAREAVKAIEEDGYEIYIVTALPEKAKEMRLENLAKEIGLIPKEIYCVGMGMSKEEAIKKVNPDVFIDDRVKYLSSVPFVYHLALLDQKESQEDKEFLVDVHVNSLKEWTEKHMPRVSKKLNRHYSHNMPLQQDLRFENIETNLQRVRMKM